MTKVSVDEAKERLPELLDEGARGEEIVIDGDGATYKITVIALETTKPIKRIADSGDGNESAPPLADMICLKP